MVSERRLRMSDNSSMRCLMMQQKLIACTEGIMHMRTLHGSHTPCLMQGYLRDLCKSENQQLA